MRRRTEVAGENANHSGGRLARARAESAARGEKEETVPKPTPGRGLYAPTAGSPDALHVAPDASGDHRTHAQRGMQFGIAPDAGFSVRCFRSRQVSTGCTSPDAAGTLFLRPVSAVWHSQRTGRTETASGAPLSTFSTLHYARL